MANQTEVPVAIPTGHYQSAYPLTEPTLSQEMIDCYSLRQTVKMLCAIDLLFSCIYSFYNPYFLIPSIIAAVGYYGANTYKSRYILTYFIYTTLDWMLKLGVFVYSVAESHTDPGVGWWIFISCSTLLNIWISKIVFKFWRCLKNVAVLELSTLKSVKPVTYYYVLW